MEHQRRILVVEDDADMRGAMAAFLEGAGYDVVEAGDGQEALEHLRRSPVCLIVLDLMMPVMNGWEFRAQQTRDPALAAIPVMIITAHNSARVADLGAIGCMTKPIELDRLLEQVERYC